MLIFRSIKFSKYQVFLILVLLGKLFINWKESLTVITKRSINEKQHVFIFILGVLFEVLSYYFVDRTFILLYFFRKVKLIEFKLKILL